MTASYVELHAKSFYSFGEGASHVHELLTQAKEYGYDALALTDTNLCGALEFARLAKSLDIKPIAGGELTMLDGSRITLLAKSKQGYANISRLFTLANAVDRREPRLDPVHLPDHAEGVVLIAGGRDGQLSQLALTGRHDDAQKLLQGYMNWFGRDSVFAELQQNLIRGDTARNRELARVARDAGVCLVPTNDVHYHAPERYRLQHALVAAKHNTTIDQALPHIRPNHHFHLKPHDAMARLFEREYPGIIDVTRRIAEQCDFNLAESINYELPEPDVPAGYTTDSYLQRLCFEAAMRRYGGISQRVQDRLDEEFALIKRHGIAGFLLLYRDIVLLAQQIMEERGLTPPEIPLEERPPGRGRGSSVALLVGYLIGISHIDPIKWDLTLERFISEDMSMLPDIDLDFPRGLRDELITRVHRRYGPDYAALTGAISTYSVKGIIQDIGKALGLPKEDLTLLSKQLHSHHADDLKEEMLRLPAYKDRVESQGWRELIELAPQLMDAPRSLGQHVGGMILSSSPISEMTPIREGAIEGRYIIDWNKDTIADANVAKIDLLSLPVLDQLEQSLDLIEQRTGSRPDLSRVEPDDNNVYDMINEGRAKGVFLLQSPAQLKMAQRLRSRNLLDLAYQVALIRPGVGVQGSSVSQFVERYRYGVAWGYDHPLEKRALERGYGIIVWQEQVVQLLADVAGVTTAEADEIRRAFGRPNNAALIEMHWQRFLEGARRNGVPDDIAEKIFGKVNGHYMFPESHSHAFAITAYQAAWLKRYHPLEFFVTLINNQPMGFYPMETLKQDARRFGVPFLNPCVNRSRALCVPEDGAVRLGLGLIKDVGEAAARAIVEEREARGRYGSPADLVSRTGITPQAAASLVMAGAFDDVSSNRRQALWEVGLANRPLRSGQRTLATTTDHTTPQLKDFLEYEKMVGEYRVMGIYPRGHVMEFVRPTLNDHVLRTSDVYNMPEDQEVLVAGWPIARQHPRGRDGTVFVTIEDECDDVQLILWKDVFARSRRALRNRVIMARGIVSRWDGTTNIIASEIRAINTDVPMPNAHDWH
ncbi:MAG: DNA polymerase III subunit alpha [Chloroflexi bacterium]|nr:DNA polymerase III subunit alpha [Chloroflexota bacterium]